MKQRPQSLIITNQLNLTFRFNFFLRKSGDKNDYPLIYSKWNTFNEITFFEQNFNNSNLKRLS